MIVLTTQLLDWLLCVLIRNQTSAACIAVSFMDMTSIKVEKAAEFFSRYEKDVSHFLLQEHILPSMSCQDVVQVCGGPGTGKTELLYYFILRCILPQAMWNGLDLGGLNLKVIFIDNDCHFNLFRLIQIFEKHLEHKRHNSIPIRREDISSFIDSRLELLEIIKCTHYDEFISSLRYLEFLRSQKYILMIDGVTSFYWSSKMRNLHSKAKMMEHQSIIASAIKTISQNGIPIVITKRKLVLSSIYDGSKLDTLWRKASIWLLELTNNCSTANSTSITVHNVTSNHRVRCTISNSGVMFHS